MDEVMRLSLRAVHKRRASHDVVRQVQDLLISGRLRPGDRLPSERDLADTLQVGRSTIREAYRALEALGVIRVQPGAAAYVAELATHAIPTGMAEPSQFRTWEQQRQLFEVRLVLDPPIAALAARRATGDHLTRLRALVRPQESNGGGQGYRGRH
jgi:GntR family transcriptional regulator, transcriptional repressor for pyruvate dehydrogenase complex